MTVFNILLILLGFTLLIVVHELGHFLAARWARIRVDGFAVGMGPHALSWRKGVGLVAGATDRVIHRRHGKIAIEMTDAELKRHGVGETEYSLRWLPIGGFVKMLGQDDLHPERALPAEVDSGRSYASAPIGKRMVVVSAGVVANALLAVVLFMIAFLAGVRFEAPVVGESIPGLPAATAAAVNSAEAAQGLPAEVADSLLDAPGLRSGDRVIAIDGAPARTFADLQIAAAMGHPSEPIQLTVARPGVPTPLEFSITPQRDALSGLLSIGITPASSTTLSDRADVRRFLEPSLVESGLASQGVRPGMTLVSVDGRPVSTWQEVEAAAARSDGRPLETVWTAPASRQSAPQEVRAVVQPTPSLPLAEVARLGAEGRSAGEPPEVEQSLLGLSPLVRIRAVMADGANVGVLQPGDVVLSVAGVEAPRIQQFRNELRSRAGQSVPLRVLRDGAVVDVTGRANREGQLGVVVGPALEIPVTAAPIEATLDRGEAKATPVAGLGLRPGTLIVAADQMPVSTWADLWRAVRAAAVRAEPGADAPLALIVLPPGREGEPPVPESVTIAIPAESAESLASLAWEFPTPSFAFEPVFTVLSAQGNPLRAVAMGFSETKKLILMTYLTIYRLFQRTVGVDQLRGPVGIVHLGTRVVDYGWAYLLFFLAMISVNLAVLNFLPLPIVDGGLFLYLVYEKLRGTPPPPAFQSAATLVGLCLLGAIFLLTFYNDVMRIFG